MSALSSDIFMRLQDLKRWQHMQQERLSKQHDNDNDTLPSLYLTNLNKKKDQLDIEQQPLIQPKTFDQLLAEKLTENNDKPVQVPTKPKKPFLKKGTGLLRYCKKDSPKPVTIVNKPITPLKVPTAKFIAKPNCIIQKSDDQVVAVNKFVDVVSSPDDQSLYERQMEKELLIFEALEDRASNSSFCSTNSSVLRILSSTPDKRLLNKQTNMANGDATQEERIMKEVQYEHFPVRSKLSDIIELDCVSITSDEVLDNRSMNYNDEHRWSDGESISDEMVNDIQYVEKRNVGVMTDSLGPPETEQSVCSDEALIKKMQELDAEIKTFRFQNASVTKMRRDLEEQQRNFNRSMRNLKQELEDKEILLKLQMEEERKKFAKEKMVFEKYVKDFKDKPTKKERDELSLLKTELENVREVLKCKETKNSMAQARLRNRVKALETENCNLKEEVEKMRKQNAKLLATTQRKPNDTRVLHEINKNLTKLSQVKKPSSEDLRKKVVEKRIDDTYSDESDESDYADYKNISPVVRKRTLFTEPVIADTNKPNANKENVIDIEKNYEQTFKSCKPTPVPKNQNEIVLSDGSKEIKYSNGNIKKISPDGNLIQMSYSHGDFKETNLLEGTIKYYFKENQIWNTTYADGTELVKFPNGQIEKKYKDGSNEVHFPNKVIKKTSADGSQEITYPDGSTVQIKNGEKTLSLPNGQKEIHTETHMRREYPDGTVKIVYPDGLQETRYSNGRVRIKDKHGNLIMDSYS